MADTFYSNGSETNDAFEIRTLAETPLSTGSFYSDTGAIGVDTDSSFYSADSISAPIDTTATPNTVVFRDYSGNFSAGTITATLSGNATTATRLATARTISLTGDATGSASFNGAANASIALTLANSGVTAGAGYNTFTVDAKGRITDASTTDYSPVSHSHVSADITDATNANTASTIVKRDASGNFSAGTITAALSGNATTATRWATARTLSFSGDATGTGSVNGTANVDFALTLSSSGATAGTYGSATDIPVITVDDKGRITSVSTTQTSVIGYYQVAVATTANITLSGPLTIDGIAVVAGDRVLVKNQSTASQNGIYVVSASAWTRATDFDTSAEITGPIIAVNKGTANGGRLYTSRFKSTDTVGTTSFTVYEIVSANGTYGISVSGSAATLTTARTINGTSFNGSANITTASWGTSRTISATGDATGSVAVDGSVDASLALTLAASGVTAGSYGSTTTVPVITVDEKGRVTAAASTAIAFPVTTVAGRTGEVTIASADITDATNLNTASMIVKRDASGNFSAGTITAALSGNASTATKLATARTFTLSGAVSGSASFDGSAAPTIATTLGTIAAPTFTGAVMIGGTTTGVIELGQQGAANSPYIDFHSGATNVDYDSRILGSGGNGTIGKGTLNFYASTHAFNGDLSIVGGIYSSSVSDGAKSSGTYTPTPIGGAFREITNAGAFTFAVPTASGVYNMMVQITNVTGAGVVTFSGFAKVTGATLTTTVGNKFQIDITKTSSGTTANIWAMQ